MVGSLIGGLYGGLYRSRMENHSYRYRNEATLYYSELAAKRELQDKMTLAFGKGAFFWGLRLSIFATTFVYVLCSDYYLHRNVMLIVESQSIDFFQRIEYIHIEISRQNINFRFYIEWYDNRIDK